VLQGGEDSQADREAGLMGKPYQALGIQWDCHPLGRVPDAELAKQLGVTISAVQAARRTRGITVYKHNGRKKYRNHRIKWDDQPLGELPDRELADQLGVEASEVGCARYKRGIPVFGSPDAEFMRRFKEISTEITDDDEQEEPEPEPEPEPELPAKGKVHVHTCTQCWKHVECDLAACKIEEGLELSDGRLRGRYKTCVDCVEQMEQDRETTHCEIVVPMRY
jgi:hypothetical protein